MAPSMPLVSRSASEILASPSTGPYTTPSITANLVCRVLFSLLFDLVCLVPLRLLYRNGEFAAVVFIGAVEVMNLQTVIHSLIWRNDNFESWWPGYGLCDVTPYIQNFLLGLYTTCLLAIMRNISTQVSLLRANPLSVKEKRRRNLVQAAIMFPLPVIQAIMTWFLTSQRYAVGTLVGCSWISSSTWPYLILFLIAPVVVAFITAGYAVLTYFRFRQLTKTTASALSSSRRANMRAQRTRRRLYLMVISIITPYLPVVVASLVVNILYMGTLQPYSYDAIHNHTVPLPWNAIIFLKASELPFVVMNNAYIPILSCIPIFLFFGMTKDAVNNYREILVFVGAGKLFPGLHQEYDPDRRVGGTSSLGSSQFATAAGTPSGKYSSVMSSRKLTTVSSSSGDSARGPQLQSLDYVTSMDVRSGEPAATRAPEPTWQQPRQDPDAPIHLPHRNPFLFRTNLDLPFPFTLPFFNRKSAPRTHSESAIALESMRPAGNNHHWQPTAEPSSIQTRVWSEEEARLWEDAAETRSVSSAQGVVVETHLTRETYEAGQQR